MPPSRPNVFRVVGLIVLGVVALALVAGVVQGWPPWPHEDRKDLAALVAHAPEVPGGRLYWEDRVHTGCSWTDCPEARLQRRYLVPCAEVDEYAARLGQQLEQLGFPASQKLVFFEDSDEWDEWDAGFVPADVNGGKIWADYGTIRGGQDLASIFPDVSDSEIAAGCTLLWTLSVTDPRPND